MSLEFLDQFNFLPDDHPLVIKRLVLYLKSSCIVAILFFMVFLLSGCFRMIDVISSIFFVLFLISLPLYLYAEITERKKKNAQSSDAGVTICGYYGGYSDSVFGKIYNSNTYPVKVGDGQGENINVSLIIKPGETWGMRIGPNNHFYIWDLDGKKIGSINPSPIIKSLIKKN